MQEPNPENVFERPTQLLVGNIVPIFAGKTALLPVDLTRARKAQQEETVLETQIEFKGISGSFAAWAEPAGPTPFSTYPLGEAPVVTQLGEDGEEQVVSAPCLMALSFNVSSLADVETLSQHYLKVYLGDDVYYMECDANLSSGITEEDFVDGKKIELSTADVEDIEENVRDPLLPMDVNSLRQIRIQILPYEDDGDDNFFELVPITPSGIKPVLV